MSIYRGQYHFRYISARGGFMKPFKWMFEEQNATEIEYKGKQVSALYRYDKKGKYRLKFTFVSTNSQHEQSIILHLYDFKGKIVIPFCTYASTYRDETLAKIAELTPAAEHRKGFGAVDKNTKGIEAWLK